MQPSRSVYFLRFRNMRRCPSSQGAPYTIRGEPRQRQRLLDIDLCYRYAKLKKNVNSRLRENRLHARMYARQLVLMHFNRFKHTSFMCDNKVKVNLVRHGASVSPPQHYGYTTTITTT
jgi:hypothetical protein